MKSNYKITAEDVAHLREENSAELRADIGNKIAKQYAQQEFGQEEMEIAESTLRLLARDTEIIVRKALSEELKFATELPHDIAMKLATDIAEVSVPMLEFSVVLNEQDLIEIVRSAKDVLCHIAIARRSDVTPKLSHELIATEQKEVVQELLDNHKARIKIADMEQIFNSYQEDESVLEAMVLRGGLPLRLVESLLSVATAALRKTLINKYKLNLPAVDEFTQNTREWATLGVLPDKGKIKGGESWQLDDLIHQLSNRGKLTSSLIIRALCMGDLPFFEKSLALRARIPQDNAYKLIRDHGDGFKKLYEQSRMPESLFDAVSVVLSIALKLIDEGLLPSNQFRSKIIEHIMQDSELQNIINMPYLLAIMGSHLKDDR